ncbi:hypothetical protein Zmor_018318 [Zophobas morio]|uniref:CRAL-TRIO domain-containing protein n=1 Tax=Zophobas morio TaxID=2755281 RepID=A0AA38MDD9_9CUCU|nr:hypothetical protein Zmor_018318 [Zophobas morio]
MSLEEAYPVNIKCKEKMDTTKQDLETIKEWLKKQPHLPDTWDDEMLMGYLRNCSFSLEKTKTKLDKYFTMKTALPEMFANRDFTKPEFQKLLKLVEVGVMPGLNSDGYSVYAARLLASENDDLDFSLVPKTILMICDIYIKKEVVGGPGDVFVVDASRFHLKYLAQITPTLAKNFFTFVNDAIAVKIKQFHIIRASAIVEFFIKFLSPFMKEKIRNRIHVHEDLDTLFDYVPKGLLPEEFGGTAGKLEKHMDEVLVAAYEYNSWLKGQEDVKADETKRMGRSVNQDNLFGMDGSFKKLVID